MKVYKYELQTDKENEIEMPRGAKIIHCHEQGNKAHIWVSFESEEFKDARKFIAMVSGIDFGGGDYVGTCHLDNGKFVNHIFETTHL